MGFPEQPSCVGVVLAGGRGTRMGGPDKPFRVLAGRPLLDRVMERLSPQADPLLISANADPVRFHAYGAPVVADALPRHQGPLAGILAGMRWTAEHRPDVRFIASVAADTPFFPRNLVRSFFDNYGARESAIALAASANGNHPVFGLWPVSLADDLEAFLLSGANPKMLDFARRHDSFTVPFDDIVLPDGRCVDPFFNINTPRDAEQAEVVALILDAWERREP
ncbi:MAG: molybdenum cofactor guanylyltransferase MobA [Alphaproteobacteria bacterium]|nr:molybdenum cofactor guanylyltransferase MobA [Alphaproteobacteria bacterium]